MSKEEELLKELNKFNVDSNAFVEKAMLKESELLKQINGGAKNAGTEWELFGNTPSSITEVTKKVNSN